jgi:hypothetical protein
MLPARILAVAAFLTIAATAWPGNRPFAADRPQKTGGVLSGVNTPTGNAQRQEAVRQLLAGAITEARRVKEPDDKAPALLEIAAMQAEIGDFAGAKATTAEIPDKNSNGSHDLSYRGAAYQAIAIAQVRAGNVSDAKKTAALLDDDPWHTLVLCAIAGAQAQAGDVPAARRTIEEAKTRIDKIDDYRAEAYDALARAQLKTGDLMAAKDSAKLAYHASEPPVMSEVAAAQAGAGHVADALATAAELGSGYDATCAFCAIAVAQAETGHPADALQTLRNHKAILDTLQHRRVWLVTYRAVISAQVKAGDFAGAKETAERAHDRNPWLMLREQLYLVVVAAQLKAGDVAAAKITAEQIAAGEYKAAAYCEVVAAQAKTGNIEQAKATAERIGYANDWSAEASRLIAAAQIKAGDLPGAVNTVTTVARKASTGGISAEYWLSFADADIAAELARAGNVATARPILEEAKSLAKKVKVHHRGGGPDSLDIDAMAKDSVCFEIAVAQAWMGDVVGALQSLDATADAKRSFRKCHLITEVVRQVTEPRSWESGIEKILSATGMNRSQCL